MTLRTAPDALCSPPPTEPVTAAEPSATPPTILGVLAGLERLAQQELAQLRRQSRQGPETTPIDPLAAQLAWDLELTGTA